MESTRGISANTFNLRERRRNVLNLVHTQNGNEGKGANLNSIAVSVNVADDASTLRAFAEKTLAKRLLEMLQQ